MPGHCTRLDSTPFPPLSCVATSSQNFNTALHMQKCMYVCMYVDMPAHISKVQ
jgi:hypothetical protein